MYVIIKCYYRPQTKFAKVMFLQVSVCPRGGIHGCLGGAWLLRGEGGTYVVAWGGVHGCSRGACVVAPGGAWLLRGACVVAPGGVHGCSGGMHGFFHEIRSMSGRYASYWNAFLLEHVIVELILVIILIKSSSEEFHLGGSLA